MRNRRHRARRNPALLGFTLPPAMDIASVGAGLVVSPMLANYVYNNFVAGTSLGGSKYTYLAVEALSVAALGFGVKRFVNPRAGNLVLLGGAARVLIDAIQVLAPTLLPATAMPTGLSGMGAQPLLGMYNPPPRLGYYNTMPQRRALSGMGSYYGAPPGRALIGVPDRLDPGQRF